MWNSVMTVGAVQFGWPRLQTLGNRACAGVRNARHEATISFYARSSRATLAAAVGTALSLCIRRLSRDTEHPPLVGKLASPTNKWTPDTSLHFQSRGRTAGGASRFRERRKVYDQEGRSGGLINNGCADSLGKDLYRESRIFALPDTRPLSPSDLAAANRRHDEMPAHSP